MSFEPTTERGRRALAIAADAGVELVSWAAQTAPTGAHPAAVARAKAAGYRTPAAKNFDPRIAWTLFEIRTAPGRACLWWKAPVERLDADGGALAHELRDLRRLEDAIDGMPDHRRAVRDANDAITSGDIAAVRRVLDAVGVS